MSPEPDSKSTNFELSVGQKLSILGESVIVERHLGGGAVGEVFIGSIAEKKIIIRTRKKNLSATQTMGEKKLLSDALTVESNTLTKINKAEGLTFADSERLSERISRAEATSPTRTIVANLFSNSDYAIQEFAPPGINPDETGPQNFLIIEKLLHAISLCHKQGISLKDFDPGTKFDRLRATPLPNGDVDFKLIDFNVTGDITQNREAREDLKNLIGHLGRILGGMKVSQWKHDQPITYEILQESISDVPQNIKSLINGVYSLYSTLTGNSDTDNQAVIEGIGGLKSFITAYNKKDIGAIVTALRNNALTSCGASTHLAQFMQEDLEVASNKTIQRIANDKVSDQVRFASKLVNFNQFVAMEFYERAQNLLSDDLVEVETSKLTVNILRTVRDLLKLNHGQAQAYHLASTLTYLYSKEITIEEIEKIRRAGSNGLTLPNNFNSTLDQIALYHGLVDTESDANTPDNNATSEQITNLENQLEAAIAQNYALTLENSQLSLTNEKLTQENLNIRNESEKSASEKQSQVESLQTEVEELKAQLQKYEEEQRANLAMLELEKNRNQELLVAAFDQEAQILELQEQLQQRNSSE